MKLAFVDNLSVGGGLSRFSYLLCKNLIDISPSLQIDYFVHAENLKRTPELRSLTGRIKVLLLETSKSPSFLDKAKVKLSHSLGITGTKDKLSEEIKQRVKAYDLVYFPSAHMMPYPDLSVPVVGTIHDFNWKYFFGRQIFSTSFVEQMNIEIVKWMTHSYTISSSYDVITEAKKLYPGLPRYPSVVHIGPVVFTDSVTDAVSMQALQTLGIDYPYLLFPGNFFPHKNHLNLFSGFSLLRKKIQYKNQKLILSGMGTEQLPYGIAEKTGVQLVSSRDYYDVRGLGYQPNHIVDALIRNAMMVVSPSLYEAICTPGMDAWAYGTPTAISDIPPFREHEQVLKIKSAFFDPMNPEHIAEVLDSCLANYEQTKLNGLISQKNINKYKWNQVANGYLDIFEKAIKK